MRGPARTTRKFVRKDTSQLVWPTLTGKTKLLTSLHEHCWISPKLSALFPIVVTTLEATENQFVALLCRGEVASRKTRVTLNAHVGSPDPFYASIDPF